MKYKENKEKNSRLKFFATAAAGITAGAFMMKETGGSKIFSKALGNVLEAASGISDDIAKLSLKEMNASNISRIAKERVLNDDSTYKMAVKNTNISKIDQSRGLFASIRDFDSFANRASYTENQITDNVTASNIMKKMRENFDGDESQEFFEQAQILVSEVLDQKHQYFESETGEVAHAIKSEFEIATAGGIFDGKSDKIANIVEDALNNSTEIISNINKEYNSLHPQVVKKYEEELIEKYSKEDDFFKGTLDRAAEVNDFLKAVKEEKIDMTDEVKYINNRFSELVEKDSRYGNLKVDSKTLRMDENNEIYSLLSMNKATDELKEEVADTIAGKLFGMRSALINKQSPDFYYLGQGTYDKVLASLTGSESGLLEHDHFKIMDKLFQYKDGMLSHLEDADNLSLMGAKAWPSSKYC